MVTTISPTARNLLLPAIGLHQPNANWTLQEAKRQYRRVQLFEHRTVRSWRVLKQPCSFFNKWYFDLWDQRLSLCQRANYYWVINTCHKLYFPLPGYNRHKYVDFDIFMSRKMNSNKWHFYVTEDEFQQVTTLVFDKMMFGIGKTGCPNSRAYCASRRPT